MEIAKEATPEVNQNAPTTKFIREVRVNYRGPKRDSIVVREASNAVSFMRKVLPDNSREHFIALYLDGANQTVGYAVVFTGTANACVAHPREVFQIAVLLGAVSLIVGHTHPSGQPLPSKEDEKVTQIFKEAGQILGIKVYDHVVIGKDSHTSLAELGLL
jgi:DNA repair protein RadC